MKNFLYLGVLLLFIMISCLLYQYFTFGINWKESYEAIVVSLVLASGWCFREMLDVFKEIKDNKY